MVVSTAVAEERGTLSLTWENDVFSGQDRHYTNGLRAAYVTAPVEPNRLETMFADDGAIVRRSFALGQQIYTPQDIFTPVPEEDDHPYAGYLFGEAAILTENDGRWDLFTVELGLIGPEALGEEAQNWVHKQLEFKQAEGWDNQLATEATLNFAYDWKGRPIAEGRIAGLEMEITPVAGGSAGTVTTNARGGAMFRVGPNLISNFGPARVRPSLTGSGHYTQGGQWYAFIGIEGRVVIRDTFVDGSLWNEGPSTEKEPLVGDVQAGFAFDIGRTQFSWTMVGRTKRYEAQDKLDAFGAFSMSVKL